MADGGDDRLIELRRGYHDRIADVRRRSAEVLRSVIEGAAAATGLIGGVDARFADRLPRVEEMGAAAAAVDTEVIGLLALESPVARDLRLILAARDVTQISLLCVGLVVDLGHRMPRVVRRLDPDLGTLLAEVGAGSDAMLQSAEAVWLSLDDDRAATLVEAARVGRSRQTALMAALIGLNGVPMDAAIDLAMVARVFERLTDHALEVAERVVFAVRGPA